MAITAQKIAELAGVSRGTVDRALKNREGVNPETKARILKIADEYNYKPNLIGKALVYSKHRIPIAVCLNSLGNPFFDEVKKGIMDAQKSYADYGINIELQEMKGFDEEEMLQRLSTLKKDVQNVIITPVSSPRFAEKINELEQSGVHVITLSSDVPGSDRLSYVGCDYEKSGKIAGRLTGLLSGGKAKLCITTGSLSHYGHRQRVDGLLEIVKGYPDIELVEILETFDDDETAKQKTAALLKEHPEVDFIYITAGGVQGTLEAIQESGKTLKACSFDDTPSTRKALESGKLLATICQEPYKQGYNAVKSIFDKVVAHEEVPAFQYSDLYIKVDTAL